MKTEELVQGDAKEKRWQWLYRLGDSPLWNITSTYLSKEKFKQFLEEYNQTHHLKVTEYGKAKVTKLVS